MTASQTSTAIGKGAGRSIDEIKVTLASVPLEMARLVEGKTREELMQPAQDGRWGVVEIVPHFRDWEVIVADRVARILSEDTPVLEEHDDSLWAIEHDYRSQDPHQGIAEFARLRQALVANVSALPSADWLRTASLPKRGIITLHWLLNNVCDHDAKHLMQFREVLA